MQHKFKQIGQLLNINVIASPTPESLQTFPVPVQKHFNRFELHFNGTGKLMIVNSLLVLMFYEVSTLLSWPLLKLFAETSCPHLEL